MSRALCVWLLVACGLNQSYAQTRHPVFAGAYTFQSSGYSATLAIVDNLWMTSALTVPGNYRLDLVSGSCLSDGAPIIGLFAGYSYERPVVGKLWFYVDAGGYLLQAQGSAGFTFKAGLGLGLAVKL